MGIPHLEDQLPIDDEMMMFDGFPMHGDRFVWILDGIDGLRMKIGWILAITKI